MIHLSSRDRICETVSQLRDLGKQFPPVRSMGRKSEKRTDRACIQSV